MSIAKATGVINFATTRVQKLNTDAPFINELTLVGDGTVSYRSGNTAVATVDAETGEVTITGIGTTSITANVTAGTNYNYTKTSVRYGLTVTEDPALGISDLSAENDAEVENAPIYDLMGRRLQQKPKSGYYIRNGKKYFVR